MDTGIHVTMHTDSVEQTIALGERLGSLLKGGEVIALFGDLGAGKTQLVKGIGRALGIRREITSPTFVIAQLYQGGRLPLAHIDLYRLSDNCFAQLEDMGWYDFLDMNAVIVVEWAEKIQEQCADENSIRIIMRYIDENRREIELCAPQRFATVARKG